MGGSSGLGVSRVLLWVVIYLGGVLLPRSCGAVGGRHWWAIPRPASLAPTVGLPSLRLAAQLGVSYTSVASLPVLLPAIGGFRFCGPVLVVAHTGSFTGSMP